MNNKIITVGSYGLCLFSPKRLNRFLKENKIRSKKILKYFQDNKEMYLKSIQEGVWLPILPIDSIDYTICVKDNIFDINWDKINENNGFNIEIENDSLWIASLGILLNWDFSVLENNDTKTISYETLDGEILNQAFEFSLPSNKYLVDISGYKRKEGVNYPNANAGYLFEFTPVENFNGYLDPREDDKYTFKIR